MKIKVTRSFKEKLNDQIDFESENIRDLIFIGYVIVYRINKKENCIEVFGFAKYQDNPFD